VPDHVSLIPINFDREDLGQALQNSGWDLDTKTLFIWEGVTQYLSESGVRATLDFLSGASSESRLLFTYIRRDFLEGQNLYGLDFLHGKMVQKEGVWLFGMNPEEVDGFLGGYGWGALDDLDYKDLADRYVKPTGRYLQTMPIERVVYAQKD
jgi:methyltransferase (TIGR00027 family)